jgi:hypothetical protein
MEWNGMVFGVSALLVQLLYVCILYVSPSLHLRLSISVYPSPSLHLRLYYSILQFHLHLHLHFHLHFPTTAEHAGARGGTVHFVHGTM